VRSDLSLVTLFDFFLFVSTSALRVSGRIGFENISFMPACSHFFSVSTMRESLDGLTLVD